MQCGTVRWKRIVRGTNGKRGKRPPFEKYVNFGPGANLAGRHTPKADMTQSPQADYSDPIDGTAQPIG
jgi:hypothetical protein